MNIIDILYIFFAGVTIYISLLFLILFFSNRRKMDYNPKAEKLKSISVIVPAHNEERTIGKVVRHLKRLNYPKRLLEIIVVDDGSKDNTALLARKAGAKVITQKNKGKAAALNAGIRAARGELVACIDADSWPEKDSLLKSVGWFNDPDVAAVTTRIFVKNRDNFLSKLQAVEYAMIAWTRKLMEYVNGIYATPGPLSIYRKNLILKLGGFDKKNATEDIEIAWRILDAGYKIKMSSARAYTIAPAKWKGWIKQRLRWNIGGIQTSAKYRNRMFKRGTGSFGFYVLPFFTLSYVFTIIALSIFTWLIYIWLYNNITFTLAAWANGLDPFKHWAFNFIPDLLLVFGIVLFAFSLYTINAGLRDMKHSRKPATWLHIGFYLTIYITIFPFLLVYSMIKYAQGYREW